MTLTISCQCTLKRIFQRASWLEICEDRFSLNQFRLNSWLSCFRLSEFCSKSHWDTRNFLSLSGISVTRECVPLKMEMYFVLCLALFTGFLLYPVKNPCKFLHLCRWRRFIYLGNNVIESNRHPGRFFCRFRHPGRLICVIYPGVEIYNIFFYCVDACDKLVLMLLELAMPVKKAPNLFPVLKVIFWRNKL